MPATFLEKEILDLTLELEAGKQSWSLHPPVTLIPYHQSSLDRWRNSQLCPGFDTKLLMMTDHTGTHVDAQTHFHPRGKCMADTPLQSLMGEALVLDVSRPEQQGPLYARDIQRKLDALGEKIRPSDILLLKCWPHPWGEGEGFDSADALAGDVAGWLLKHEIRLLGTDIPTVDDLSNPHKDLHVRLLDQGVPIIENLVNLEKIADRRVHFMALPLKLRGATGSPVRALAFL